VVVTNAALAQLAARTVLTGWTSTTAQTAVRFAVTRTRTVHQAGRVVAAAAATAHSVEREAIRVTRIA